MGGRGASSGTSKNGKKYGTEYTTLLSSGNIKFVRKNEGSATAPLETMTKGRVYVTVNKRDMLKSISYYNKENKKYEQIDITHAHKVNGKLEKPHVHIGYEHNEGGDRLLTRQEQALVDKVKKLWYNRSNGQ